MGEDHSNFFFAFDFPNYISMQYISRLIKLNHISQLSSDYILYILVLYKENSHNNL
jgi:hypothetical protein